MADLYENNLPPSGAAATSETASAAMSSFCENNAPLSTDNFICRIIKEYPEYKTRMCNSICIGQECLYGKRCFFAHSSSELTLIAKLRTELGY
jgi:hypothetical protein